VTASTHQGTHQRAAALLAVHAFLFGAIALVCYAAPEVVFGPAAWLQLPRLAVLLLAAALAALAIVLIGSARSGTPQQVWLASMPPAEAAVARTQVFSLVLYLIREGLLFFVLMSWALLARRTDSQLHKRLVILATVLPLTAAFERLAGVGLFPRFGLYNEAFWDVCCLLWIMPMFLWDLAGSGKVHRAYLIWLILFGVTAIPVHLLRETAWWNAAAARLPGGERVSPAFTCETTGSRPWRRR